MNETANLEIYLPYIVLVIYYLVAFRLWLPTQPKDPLAENEKPDNKLAPPLPDPAYRQALQEPSAIHKAPTLNGDALAAVRALDSQFDEKAFLDGAVRAFEIILTAYAKGDRPVLESLLDIGPLSVFNATIMQRQHKHQTLALFLVGVGQAQIVDCKINGSLATITVRFVSDMIVSTHAEDGTVIDGDPEQIARMTDRWTFRRDLSSSNPNWKLAATRPDDSCNAARRAGHAKDAISL
ncbi:Tim44 domain-containing protein [Pseudaminobacter arsenicus]|uniref:Tim44 domain-containing protein n=1 Tax=Borborobacter arsenicus TaxID=1851146 RepID=A0A432VAJ8_9HYPH|nr:Tim44/TimA family putative adaptor protein [Pseudaminobacter arsenicus]RUM99135.1 Tim44 domain-containing protein [Pseudaminobacter arsenicus]